jgi:Na+/melibiose symporter-like transporter
VAGTPLLAHGAHAPGSGLSPGLSTRALLAYGFLRAPLALLELPLFVLLPAFYGREAGLSLALVGLVLFGARLIDALADPLIGRAIDRTRGVTDYRRWVVVACVPLAAGFAAMLHPPAWSTTGLAVWLAAGSVVTYLAWSTVTIAHQAWGAELGADPATRVRVTGLREACGLAGVLASAALLDPRHVSTLSVLLAGALLLAAWLVRHAPTPVPAPVTGASDAPRGPAVSGPAPIARIAPWRQLFAHRAFTRLLAVFMLNGTASALPATLVLFFVADVLGDASRAPLFLLIYFAAAAIGMPLWIRLGVRLGAKRAWLFGMVASVLAFAWAFALGPGEWVAFGVICAVTGLALGADLAMPPALLAAVIAAAGESGSREGAYFGLWSLATKLNLALAAGLGLPLISLLGYQPGVAGTVTEALSFAYAALPCLIKTAAAWLLWRLPNPDLAAAGPPSHRMDA